MLLFFLLSVYLFLFLSHSMQYNIPIILTYNELFILSFRVRLASGIASTLRLLSAQVWGEACIVENNFENWTGTCERHNDKINGNFRWMHFLFFNVEPSNIYVIWIVFFFFFCFSACSCRYSLFTFSCPFSFYGKNNFSWLSE